jgi:hypothetical protein
VGGSIDQDSWDILVAYNSALSQLHDTGPEFNGFHQGFTGRKIDYRDGRFANASDTIEARWESMEVDVYAQFVAGIVTGWAEDKVKTRAEFTRLMNTTPPLMGGGTNALDYWMGLLDDPTNKEWLGFYARTELSSWGA